MSAHYLKGSEPSSIPPKRWKTQPCSPHTVKSHTGAPIAGLPRHYCVTQNCLGSGYLGVAEMAGGLTLSLVHGGDILEAFTDIFFDIGFTCGEQVPYRP